MNLPNLENAGLVLEGGGFRGIYTTGVLDYFMEQGLYLPNVYGVSAGALNAIGYAAKQPGRNAQRAQYAQVSLRLQFGIYF